MKIAIPVRNGFVNEHFGHTDAYMIYLISEDQQVLSSEQVKAFDGCGCKSGIAEILAQHGVTLMLAGNIGAGAVYHLAEHGIDVIRGCAGRTDDVVQAFIKGHLEDSHQTCQQHENCDNHGGGHGHHHA